MTTPFRFINPVQQYLVQSAVKVLAGGNLYFYASGTSTPQATYTSSSLGTANPNPVPLNASGVPVADIWMSGNYRVVLEDSAGNVLWTVDNVGVPGGSAQVIPTLVANDFLSTDGTNLIWQPIAQVPDQTGQSGKFLTTNGTTASWGNLPATPAGPVVASGSLVIGALTMQWGSGTLPASGANNTNVAVTYGKAFSGLPYHVEIEGASGSGVTSGGGMLITGATNRSATGFTAVADTNAGFASGGSFPITAAVPFTWFAIGPT